MLLDYKPIRSYVLRAGRISRRQQYGLETCLRDFGLSTDNCAWDLTAIFHRQAKTIVEIGFGMGQSLLLTAQQQPEINFIGIEVHRPGIGNLAADLRASRITNVRIATIDAIDVFRTYIAANSLTGIQIFFPDPWPKQRHHKRRLINLNFAKCLIEALKPGGFIHCATDWDDYADHMLRVFNSNSQLTAVNVADERPQTKFERRGNKLGLKTHDLIFIKNL